MYTIIVAFDKNRGIGKNNTLPWHFRDDLNYFSKLTIGNNNNAIIMGKNTWNSLRGPLKKRDNLIVSTSLSIDKNSPKNNYVKTFTSLEEIDSFCNTQKYTKVWIIGGSQIYSEFLTMNKVDKLYVTAIDSSYECDVFFPKLEESQWNLISQETKIENEISLSYLLYEKKTTI
jgi:dihydrofolate reductase